MEENRNAKPNRHGKKWTETEKTQLLTELSQNKPYNEIATIHERTNGGIWSRTREIAYTFYKQGKSRQDILQETRLTDEQLDETIQRYDEKQKQKRERPAKPEKPTNNAMTLAQAFDEIAQLKTQLSRIEAKLDAIVR
jgi:hypothetical protein